MQRIGILRFAATTLPAAILACTPAWLNNTSSLGGDTPGGRGSVQVIFVNNTPWRAVFTVGVYDPQDQNSVPQIEQFQVDAGAADNGFNRGLAGNESSDVISFTCGRAVSIGDAALLDRIAETNPTPTNSGPLAAEALILGVGFSEKPLDDAEADSVFVASADPLVTLQGAEFQCDSLLVYTFTPDPAIAGRVLSTLDVILP